MPVGQPTPSTPTYLAQIVTVDPTQRIVDAVLNASGQRLQIMTTPICSRWPMVGETWTVHFINNTPYLGEPYQQYQIGSGSSQTGIEEIPAGDAWINSPTGNVHVIGSSTGVTDFAFNHNNVVPAPPSTNGLALQTNGVGGTYWGTISAGGGSSLVARAHRAAAMSTGASFTTIPLDTVDRDPSGMVDTTNGWITIPVAGYYLIQGNLGWAASSSSIDVTIAIAVNGTVVSRGDEAPNITNGANGTARGISDLIYCNAGDHVQLQGYTTSSLALTFSGSALNYLAVTAVASLPGVTGTTTVAKAYRNAAQSIAGGWNKIALDAVVFDPAGRFDVVTNHRYNVPASGYYQVNAEVLTTAAGAGDDNLIGIYKNGAAVTYGTRFYPTTTAGAITASVVSDIIQCNAGDYLELYFYSGGATLSTGSPDNTYMSVVQVGTSMNFTSAGGDLSGTYPNPTVVSRGNGTSNGLGTTFSNAAGGQQVGGCSITVTRATASVRFTGSVTGYTGVANSNVQLYWQEDGGTWLTSTHQVGNFFFNAANQHLMVCAWDVIIPSVAQGAHTFYINSNCSAGSWTRDGNDWFNGTLTELI